MRDECCAGFVFGKKSKMAAPITDSKYPSLILSTNAADVVRWLNALSSMDMRSIASDDVLTSLVTDYFVRSQIDNTDDDSESDSSDGDVDTGIDPPVVDIVAGEVNNDVTLTALMVLACL